MTMLLGVWFELFDEYYPHPQESGGLYSSWAS